MSRRLYDWFMLPHSIAAARRVGVPDSARILDVGCGNHSPRKVKTYYPRCEYHGIDNTRWNQDERDDSAIDRFFRVDLDAPGQLDVLPSGHYDMVICSHVLEHLIRPYQAVAEIMGKVKPGGGLYIECPSQRSLRLPFAADGFYGIHGCLNFHDDNTHKTMVDLEHVAELLRASGFTVTGPSPTRLYRRVFLLPLYVAAVLCVKRFVPASILWDVTGFAQSLTAKRVD